MRPSLLALMIFVPLAAACSVPPPPAEVVKVREEAPITAEACAKLGGALERAGMLGRERGLSIIASE